MLVWICVDSDISKLGFPWCFVRRSSRCALIFCFCRCSKDAGCCGGGSDRAECFLRRGLPDSSSDQTKPDTAAGQKRSEQWSGKEEEEPAAHLVYPHRRPGVCVNKVVNVKPDVWMITSPKYRILDHVSIRTGDCTLQIHFMIISFKLLGSKNT